MAVIHNNAEHSIAEKINMIENEASGRNTKLFIQLGILLLVFVLLHSYPGGVAELGSAVCELLQNTGKMFFFSVIIMMGIWLCGFLIIPVAIIGVIRELLRDPKTKKEKDEVGILKSGLEGETKALNALSNLPDNYHLFTNTVINYGGGQSETDLIVVGPTGVFIIEVKNYKGEVLGHCDDKMLTHIKTRGDRERVYNPLKQVSTHVYRLANYLRDKGIQCWVEGLVFFINDELILQIDGSTDLKRKYIHNSKELLQLIEQKQENMSLHIVSDIVKIVENM